MTYAAFLLLFVAPPIAALAAGRRLPAGAGRALALIALAALVYATPWDNYLVARGVWRYGADHVLGFIGYVPIEEYALFVLQSLLVGLLFLRLRGTPDPSPAPRLLRPLLVAGWALVAAAGVGLVAFGPDDALYLGLTFAWAAPALAGLSLIGSRHVWANRKPAALCVGAASLYLWTIDRVALGFGIWHIDERFSLGMIAGLPIEEAVFFSITTWLCIQGLAMLLPEHVQVPA